MVAQAQTQVKAVVKKNEAPLPSVDIASLEKMSGAGLENIGSQDVALPFLKILSQLSPQVTAGDSKYIANARPGMIYNTVSDQLYDGPAGIRVVPCFYKLEYLEWRDRGKEGAGAPVAIYDSSSDILTKTKRGPDKKDRLENGNYIEETASHYVLLVDENDQPKESALITMKATQRKKSRKWNSMMMTQRRKGVKGFFMPPAFSQIYVLKTILEKNSLGSWYGWEIEWNKDIPNNTLLNAAQDFYMSCKKGAVNVKHGEEEVEATTEETPF
jgi:hypothetical protein